MILHRLFLKNNKCQRNAMLLFSNNFFVFLVKKRMNSRTLAG